MTTINEIDLIAGLDPNMLDNDNNCNFNEKEKTLNYNSDAPFDKNALLTDTQSMCSYLAIDKKNNHKRHNDFKKSLKEKNYKLIKTLIKICLFSFSFMIIELIGGYISNSLAIMTDAAHLLSDLSGFLITIVSLYVALNPANSKMSYGYHRYEVLGSLTSILIIWALTLYLVVEAFHRFFNPKPINAIIMMGIASIGLIFNLTMAYILLNDSTIVNNFERGSHKDLDISHADESEHKELINNNDEIEDENPLDTEKTLKKTLLDKEDKQKEVKKDENMISRTTLIHILGDAIQSLGVLIASIIIYFFQDHYPLIVKVDPVCTFLFAIIVIYITMGVTADCINVLLEASPLSEENKNKFIEELLKVDKVDLHDIHIWSISVGKVAITAHYISNNPQKTLEKATKICKKYGIYHSTIQVEDYTQRRRESFEVCNHLNDNQIHFTK